MTLGAPRSDVVWTADDGDNGKEVARHYGVEGTLRHCRSSMDVYVQRMRCTVEREYTTDHVAGTTLANYGERGDRHGHHQSAR